MNTPVDIASPLTPTELVASDGSFFDRLTVMATSLLGVPVAMVAIIEENRQIFPASCILSGVLVGVTETPLSHSICAQVVKLEEPLVINDTRQHPMTLDNPAVTEAGILAYAGFPLVNEEGKSFGTFCAIDYAPHEWSTNDVALLRMLALQVTSEIQLRTALNRLQHDNATLTAVAEKRAKINRANRHDLRTPLNAMLLGLEAVEEFGHVNAEQKESLEMARRNGLQLMSMVDQMLDIGNIDRMGNAALFRQRLQARELVNAAIDQTGILATDKEITLTSHCESVTHLSADEDKMVRVLVNLISNAIKFTPAGGQVTIQVKDMPGPDLVDHVFFEIADTGIGISPGHQELIFNEGYRVNPEATTKDSTGLGLAFCKTIVEAHGGDIGVISEPGQGSAFYFKLPLETAEV
ncbi:signal transduction histidine kinase [Prosthecobacter fusiformis]|uniref:histidine kinase n=1 Tax=Prosthecobacter fusiformis TaxID=48464 RepID=A0A4R7RJ70_9BACT|nr:GAF domain-containing sensor histidine kinase [Prosthecobacter fusiformis]TDU64158.1 signal transduction histidine kinase [Prosthecobacter fusiformis]